MKASVCRVGDIADQIRGVTYQKQDASKSQLPGYLPVIRAGNITENGLLYDDLVYVPSSKISPKQKVRKNDVIIAASSGSIDVVGKAALALEDFDGGFGAFCKVLRPREGVNPVYFGHFFKTPDYRRRISSLAAGANINNLRNEDLDELRILLPPLAEQKRIAAILDAADALRVKRRDALAQLGDLIQSTFLEMFGDPVTNPKGWKMGVLGDVVQRLDGGKNIAQSEVPTKYRVLKVSAVTSGKYLPEESKYLPVDFNVPDSYLVRKGDLLISRANTVELIGATAYVWETPENMVLPDKIWKFIWRANAGIEPLYVYHLSQNSEFRNILRSRASGTSGSMKNIAKPKLLGLPIPLPTAGLQRQFAELVKSVELQKSHMRKHLAEVDVLISSIQSRAFSGEF